MKAGITRRGFVLGTAAAAVMAGLAGCTPGGGKATSEKNASVAPAPVTAGDTEYYKSDYAYTAEDEKRLYDEEVSLGKRIVHEGAILLKNEGAALPLSAANDRIVPFGNAGPSYLAGLDSLMKGAGFAFDDAAWEFYSNGSKNSLGWQVNENPWARVEEAGIIQNASGTALVILGRRAREACDAQWMPEHDYLALSAEEKELLNGVAELRRAGTFSKMVVLVSAPNTISWEDGPWSDAVDSLVWFGNITQNNYSIPNVYGCAALVELLAGEVSPSGRLVDTIYKDNQANPVMANFGRIDADLSHLSEGKDAEVQTETDAWKPSNDKGNHWRHNYVYAEGIYVGYRYAETRYEDVVLGQGNAGDFAYGSYVAYPFGFGLSYTTFSYSDFSVEESADALTVSVTVTNTGRVAGKEAVCAYVQAPYTEYDRANGVERASIELKGYEKTQLLEPGASTELSLAISKRDLAAYDAEGAKTYVLEDGDYYVTVATSAHAAMNNVLAAKGKTVSDGMDAEGDDGFVWVWSNPDFDAETFAVSEVGSPITNLFDDVDPNKNPLVKDENDITWLSRSDWQKTLPVAPISLVYTDALADLAKPITYQAGSGDASGAPKHEFGKDSSVVLVDMHGKDYDDADWDKLVSRLTYEEMVDFINDPEAAIAKIGKPKTVAGNGSQGWLFASTYFASGLSGLWWPTKETVAATFSTEVHELVGKLTGESLLHSATVEKKSTSLYGWSCNVHRSPYSGRNFEYYSEDPYVGGRACAEETRGIASKGVLVYIKHCAGNDQEEYRHGVPSWLNEQTLREIYLRQFEKAVVDGGASGIMTGFHRLGITWSGENRALIKGFLEGELGYRGTTITDQFEADYMDAPDGLLAGTHVWLGTTSDTSGRKVCREVLLQDDYKSDPLIQDALYEACHRALYNYANSMAMNGLTHDYAFVGDKPIATAYAEPSADMSATALRAYGSNPPVKFYGDKTFVAAKSGLISAPSTRGSWDVKEDGSLSLALSDGTELDVADDGSLLSWEVEVGGTPSPNVISRHELIEAYNACFDAKIDSGDKLVFSLSFSAGSDSVEGENPDSLEMSRGEAVTLPECPYTGEHLVFDGWSIGGKTYPAGSEYTPDAYADAEAVGTWSVTTLAEATTQDGFKLSWVQEPGIPLVLRADGSATLDVVQGWVCSGSWKIEGSGSGEGILSVSNEKGKLVALASEGEIAELVQDGYYYDWNQPDRGYGSGVFVTTLTHRIDLAGLAEAYNEEFGTSYSGLSVQSGTATFAPQKAGAN